MPPTTATVESLVGWLDQSGAVGRFQTGQPVVIEISPGDSTRYVLAAIPPTASTFLTDSRHGPYIAAADAILSVVSGSFPTSFPVLTGPDVPVPHPSYVETKLPHAAPAAVAVVGITWGRLVGCSAAEIAATYTGSFTDPAISRWDPARFTVEETTR